MKDTLQTFHEFSDAVIRSLNDGKVAPTGGSEDVCSLIIIVAGEDREPPVTCSLNYDREKQLWELTQPELAERTAGDPS